MTVPRELAVLLDQRLVGHLTRTAETQVYRFRYAEGWLGDPHAYRSLARWDCRPRPHG